MKTHMVVGQVWGRRRRNGTVGEITLNQNKTLRILGKTTRQKGRPGKPPLFKGVLVNWPSAKKGREATHLNEKRTKRNVVGEYNE